MKILWQIKISILDKNNNVLSFRWLDAFQTRKAAVAHLTNDGFKKSKGCWEKIVRRTIHPKNRRVYERQTRYRARIWRSPPISSYVPCSFTF